MGGWRNARAPLACGVLKGGSSTPLSAGATLRRWAILLSNLPGAIVLAAIMAIAPAAMAECHMERVSTVPLTEGARPVTRVIINDQAIQMMVDTGAQETSVTPGAATVLLLRRDPQRRTRIVTVAGPEITANAIVDKLSIGTINYSNLNIPVYQLGQVSEGELTAGIVGADLVSGFDLELDIPGRTLSFYRVSDCDSIRPPWDGPYDTVVGRVTSRRQFVFPVSLNGHAVTALFDTGSWSELLSREKAESIGISEAELAQDATGTGHSGVFHQMEFRRHKFDSVTIGAETFHDSLVLVTDFQQGGEVDMLVGADYMRWRRFFLSYSTATLFIQKVPRR